MNGEYVALVEASANKLQILKKLNAKEKGNPWTYNNNTGEVLYNGDDVEVMDFDKPTRDLIIQIES